jgi:hypothetical protein
MDRPYWHKSQATTRNKISHHHLDPQMRESFEH